jgi:hypothetical protein
MSVEYREPAPEKDSQRVYAALRKAGLKPWPKHHRDHQLRLAPSLVADVPDDATNLEWFGWPVIVDTSLSVGTIIVEPRA